MPNVTYEGVTYACDIAYKGADYVHLVKSDKTPIAYFDGVSSFSGFTISDGSWTTPTTDPNCNFALYDCEGHLKDSGDKVVPISRGGTGATTSAAAVTNLDLPTNIGTVQMVVTFSDNTTATYTIYGRAAT